jgi:hypothetical protein
MSRLQLAVLALIAVVTIAATVAYGILRLYAA